MRGAAKHNTPSSCAMVNALASVDGRVRNFWLGVLVQGEVTTREVEVRVREGERGARPAVEEEDLRHKHMVMNVNIYNMNSYVYKYYAYR